MRGKHKNGQNPRSLANLKPIQPGERRNPTGRRTAGATIREHINVMAEADLTAEELRKIARDPEAGWSSRTAAERILRAMESGDLADFAPLLRGAILRRHLGNPGGN